MEYALGDLIVVMGLTTAKTILMKLVAIQLAHLMNSNATIHHSVFISK